MPRTKAKSGQHSRQRTKHTLNLAAVVHHIYPSKYLVRCGVLDTYLTRARSAHAIDPVKPILDNNSHISEQPVKRSMSTRIYTKSDNCSLFMNVAQGIGYIIANCKQLPHNLKMSLHYLQKSYFFKTGFSSFSHPNVPASIVIAFPVNIYH